MAFEALFLSVLSPTRSPTRKRVASALALAPKRQEVKSEDEGEDVTLLETYGGQNATGLQHTYSEVTESVNDSISDGIKNLTRIMNVQRLGTGRRPLHTRRQTRRTLRGSRQVQGGVVGGPAGEH